MRWVAILLMLGAFGLPASADSDTAGPLLPADRVIVAQYLDSVAPLTGANTSLSAQSVSTDVERWRSLVVIHFPAGEVDNALAVMACESQGYERAVNPTSGASGLFQVMPFWADHFGVPRDWLLHAPDNVRIARRVWGIQGWGGWVCQP